MLYSQAATAQIFMIMIRVDVTQANYGDDSMSSKLPMLWSPRRKKRILVFFASELHVH